MFCFSALFYILIQELIHDQWTQLVNISSITHRPPTVCDLHWLLRVYSLCLASRIVFNEHPVCYLFCRSLWTRAYCEKAKSLLHYCFCFIGHTYSLMCGLTLGIQHFAVLFDIEYALRSSTTVFVISIIVTLNALCLVMKTQRKFLELLEHC